MEQANQDEAKTCQVCGRHHDLASWRSLVLVAVWTPGDFAPLELRQCACGNTLSAELPAGEQVGQGPSP